jgi:uncharacterized membrane protein
MKEKIPLTNLTLGLLIMCSIIFGICLVLVQQAYQNGESYLILAWLGVSMMGLLKVILGVYKRAAKK